MHGTLAMGEIQDVKEKFIQELHDNHERPLRCLNSVYHLKVSLWSRSVRNIELLVSMI